MGLIVVGLSHKTAPVEIREKLSLSGGKLLETLKTIRSLADVQEAVVLSTCNRTEIYARPQSTRRAAIKAVSDLLKTNYAGSGLTKALYHREGEGAVRHVFRVSAGLDSLVVGETEILGQVKSAYLTAKTAGATGKVTNVLFQRALFVGKTVRLQTEISDGASSVGNAAVHLAEQIFGKLQGHRILLIGAGEIAETTARHLLSQKVGGVTVLNRTLENARRLARLLNGQAKPYGDLEGELKSADIVIASVSAPNPIITEEMIRRVMPARDQRSLYFVDIAVPRNVEPSVHALDNVFVYDIDDLQDLVEENLGRRRRAVRQAEHMVEARTKEFAGWLEGALSGKTRALRHQMNEIEASHSS